MKAFLLIDFLNRIPPRVLVDTLAFDFGHIFPFLLLYWSFIDYLSGIFPIEYILIPCCHFLCVNSGTDGRAYQQIVLLLSLISIPNNVSSFGQRKPVMLAWDQPSVRDMTKKKKGSHVTYYKISIYFDVSMSISCKYLYNHFCFEEIIYIVIELLELI